MQKLLTGVDNGLPPIPPVMLVQMNKTQMAMAPPNTTPSLRVGNCREGLLVVKASMAGWLTGPWCERYGSIPVSTDFIRGRHPNNQHTTLTSDSDIDVWIKDAYRYKPRDKEEVTMPRESIDSFYKWPNPNRILCLDFADPKIKLGDLFKDPKNRFWLVPLGLPAKTPSGTTPHPWYKVDEDEAKRLGDVGAWFQARAPLRCGIEDPAAGDYAVLVDLQAKAKNDSRLAQLPRLPKERAADVDLKPYYEALGDWSDVWVKETLTFDGKDVKNAHLDIPHYTVVMTTVEGMPGPRELEPYAGPQTTRGEKRAAPTADPPAPAPEAKEAKIEGAAEGQAPAPTSS
jgi:hypothetical protein